MTKMIINRNGALAIDRPGRGWVMVDCPFRSTWRCGDWCPLFGDPIRRDVPDQPKLMLRICKRVFYMREVDFVDYRGTEEEKSEQGNTAED